MGLWQESPTVELDALPVDELRRRVQAAVEGLIEPESWKRQVEIQEIEMNCIADFVHSVKNLPATRETEDRP